MHFNLNRRWSGDQTAAAILFPQLAQIYSVVKERWSIYAYFPIESCHFRMEPCHFRVEPCHFSSPLLVFVPMA